MTVDIENKEWPEDGRLPELAGKANPFVAPDGYFEGLEERITTAIKMEELKVNIPDTAFAVPEGYFENLSSQIQSRIFVEEALSTEEAFTVPEDYFQELNSNIQSRIAVEQAMEAGDGFELPAGYFENLSSQIQSRVFVEEALSTEEAFTVPERYFEELNAKILNQTVTRETVQRKSGIIRLMRSTAFKYATAACFILVAGVGYLFAPSVNSAEEHDASYLHRQLSNVPLNELQGYIELNMEGADIQHTVSFEELPVKDAEFNAALQEYVEMQ